jgi:predicted GIY-YIG superfamily endonuclease
MLDEVPYWVYVLECRPRWFVEDFDAWQRKAEKRLGYTPEWLRMAWEHNGYLYIGQTEDLEKRLGQHSKNKNSSDFTTLYEPSGVRRLRAAHTRNQAERLERRIAESYYDSENTYAYYR